MVLLFESKIYCFCLFCIFDEKKIGLHFLSQKSVHQISVTYDTYSISNNNIIKFIYFDTQGSSFSKKNFI